MKLYLVQHGEAAPTAASDERELTEEGRYDVESIAAFLKDANITVDRVIHSGKRRALQTSEILAAALAGGATLETTSMIEPNAPPEPFAREVGELSADTMVVGHMPFVSRLVAYFMTGAADRIVTTYHPGSVVCLEREMGGEWTIAWMLRPELFL